MFDVLGRPRGAASLVGASAIAIVAAMASPASAQEQQRSFDIPAQPLASALLEFSRQADVLVMMDQANVSGIEAPALRGSYTPTDALNRLIEGSGLRAFPREGGGFALSDPNRPTRLGDASEAAPSDEGVAEILVTGQRSLNADIRRSEDDVQPYVVFSQEEIESSQAANVEEFLRARLPMNSQRTSNAQATNTASVNNNSEISLRGLGSNQTLILIDGRRAPRLSRAGEFFQADINGVPMSSIERIEVLPSTAGGIYGGGAVGGVINIIRKHDYTGLVVAAGHGGAFDGGAEGDWLEISAGRVFNRGRTSANMSLAHRLRGPLRVGDNDLSLAGRARFAANDPNSSPFAASTTNIVSLGGDLTLDDGTALNSTHTFVPLGYAGASTDNGHAFVANAGMYNLELSSDAFGTEALLLPETEVSSVSVDVRHELRPGLDLFLSAGASESRAGSQYVPPGNGGVIAADAPTNPFQQDIFVVFPLEGVPHRNIESISTTFDVTTGAIFQLPENWTGSLEYSRSVAGSEGESAQALFDFSIFTDINTGALNVLRDIRAYPVNFLPYLAPGSDTFNRLAETQQDVLSARLAGSLFELPAGATTLNLLVERRVDTAQANSLETQGYQLFYPDKSQTVSSVYAEISVPLISSQMNVPLVHALDLNASLRHDRYQTRVTDPQYAIVPPAPPFTETETELESSDFTVGLRWTAFRELVVRGSFATGFLPPSISQLTELRIPWVGPFYYNDPFRGNTPVGTDAPFEYAIGGNPDLQPEDSESFSLGLIFTPAAVDGLRLSIDYTDIEKSGEIQTLPTDDLINGSIVVPGRVVRADPLPGDPAGWLGPIILLDERLANVSSTSVAAYDIQVEYQRDFGRFGEIRLYATATHQVEFSRQVFSSSAQYDTVGYSDGPLEWRGNVGVDWALGNLTFFWNAQVYDDFSRRTGVNPGSAANDERVELQGAERIPSQIYHDVALRYELGNRGDFFDNVSIFAGVQNAFDEAPPIVAAPTGGYSGYGDPRMRRFSVGIRKEFGQ